MRGWTEAGLPEQLAYVEECGVVEELQPRAQPGGLDEFASPGEIYRAATCLQERSKQEKELPEPT